MEAKFVGVVSWFSAKKGYGFITWSDANGNPNKDLFVHFSDIDFEGFKTLQAGARVSFDVGENRSGVPKAIGVKTL
jgi:CspA family cold shock protein